MDTIPLLPDFRDLLRFLNDEGVQYLVVGGMAVNLYGYHRATGDMDVWVAVTSDNDVQDAAKMRKMQVMRSQDFAVILESPPPPDIDEGEAANVNLSADEVDEWLDFFNSGNTN